VFRRPSSFPEKSACTLRDRACQILNDNPSPIEHVVNRGIEAWSAADFGENRSGNTHEGATFVRHRKYRARPFGEDTPFGRTSERVESLGIEN